MPRKDRKPVVKICPICGKEFTHQGNAVRCKDCRFKCTRCGKPKDYYGKLCGHCKHEVEKEKAPTCKYPGCSTKVIPSDSGSGYCQKHTDHSARIKNLMKSNERRYSSHPDYPKMQTAKLRDVPVVCCVCGKPFLAMRETVNKSKKVKTGLVCSRQCQGIRAAWLTPKSATSIELAIEKSLQQRGVIYQAQVPLCGITIVDFYLPELKTVIYCDGRYWHSSTKRQASDKRQNKTLKRNGYKVFRFSEDDINKSPDDCLNRIPNLTKPPFHQLKLPTF